MRMNPKGLRLLLLAVLPIVSRAQLPTPPPPVAISYELQDLRHTVFRSEEGAPTDATAMAQTTDGFLWIATPTGLFRYDGVRFDRGLDTRLKSSSVSALLAEPDGSLWIGYYFGGVSVLKDGRVRHIDGGRLPPGSVIQFARSADGALWVSTTNGLGRLVGDKWQLIDETLGYPGGLPEWIGSSSAGFLVVGSTASFVYSPESGLFQRHSRLEGEQLRYRVTPDSAWRPNFFNPNTHTTWPNGALFDRAGSFLAPAHDRGLVQYRWPAGPGALPQEDRFTDIKGEIITIFEDRESDIWVGTDQGLDRFSIAKARRLEISNPEGKALLIPGERGDVWVSRLNHTVARLDQGQGEIPSLGESVFAAFRDVDGTLWVAGKDGIFEYADGKVRRQLPLPVSASQFPQLKDANSIFQAIAVDDQGAVWLSISRVGLYRWSGEGWTKAEEHYALPHGPAVRLLLDARRRLWIGYPNDQLAIMEGDRPRIFTAADGLDVGTVLALDVEKTHAWIAGDHGIAAMIGNRFVPLRGVGNVDFHPSSGIVETSAGELWINAPEGIYRIAAASVAGALTAAPQPVAFELLNWLDGVSAGIELIRPGPTMLRTSDDQLWIARGLGIWSIDSAHIPRNPVAPIVSIEGVVGDGVHYEPGSSVVLGPGSRNIQIDYTAASLRQPERVRFRYRLAPVEEKWQDAGERRQAYYTFLGPGQYEFQAMAANEDGVWSVSEASLRFTVKPAFYQRLGFKILLGVAAMLLLALLFALRLEQVQRRYRRGVEARHAERERIARDLHDTLLQGVQALLFRLQIWEGDPDTPERLRKEILGVSHQTKSIVAEGRERILTMRRTDAQPADLAESLTAIGNEASAGNGAGIDVTIVGMTRTLTLEAKEQLLEIAREAVRNAYKHAGASRIAVSLEYRKRSLILSIVDDGHGFDPAVAKERQEAGHFGLTGMRERARQLHAQFRVHSEPSVGTRIEVIVPGGAAYLDVFRWPWQRARKTDGQSVDGGSKL
jgi:signal transduction histidine kinase/ligand-binding sensor domain-containing protein